MQGLVPGVTGCRVFMESQVPSPRGSLQEPVLEYSVLLCLTPAVPIFKTATSCLCLIGCPPKDDTATGKGKGKGTSEGGGVTAPVRVTVPVAGTLVGVESPVLTGQ